MITLVQELQKRFHNFIQHHQLIQEGEKTLLAVSGGLDSMVMASLFCKSPYEIAIAHCNFGLRGVDSDQDEALVSRWAADNGVSCFTKKITLKKSNIQLEARDKRYLWFAELCRKHNFKKIATAHHINDSLETTLFNLVRGTGIKGLLGISSANETKIRPLLSFTKADLQTYAKKNEIPWREDASNAKLDYDRNKLRLEVIPKLKELNGSLEKTYLLTKERMDLLSELVQVKARNILQHYFNKKEGELSLIWMKEGYDLLLLSEILSEYGFNYVTAKEIYEAINQPGKIFLAEKWKVIMDRGRLYIRPIEKNTLELLIDADGKYAIGKYQFIVQTQDLKTCNWTTGERNEKQAYLDFSKIRFPIKIRKWNQGDVFRPLGMVGRKKISDLLIDLKMPLAKKDDILVIESAGKIAWVAGVRISEDFKVLEGCEKVWSIKFSQNKT